MGKLISKQDIILECLAEGQDIRRVAKKLGISVNQVIRAATKERPEK